MQTENYPIIDLRNLRFTTVESEDDKPEVWLCFYANEKDMQQLNRKDYRIGAIRFAQWRDLEIFFSLNSRLIARLASTNKYRGVRK